MTNVTSASSTPSRTPEIGLVADGLSFAARTYREYLRADEAASVAEDHDHPLVIKANELRMAISTTPAQTVDDMLIKLELIAQGLADRYPGALHDAMDFASASTLMADLRRLKAAPELFTSAATAEDPILPLYREWWDAVTTWRRGEDGVFGVDWDNSPKCRDADAREDRLVEAMCTMAPTSMAGVAAFAHVLWREGGPQSHRHANDYAEECGCTKNKLIAAIWRGTSGRAGLPPHPDDADEMLDAMLGEGDRS